MVSTALSPAARARLTSTAADVDVPPGARASTTAAPAATPAPPAPASPKPDVQAAARQRATAQSGGLRASLDAQLDAGTPAPTTYEEKLAAYTTAHDAWQKQTDDYWTNMRNTRRAGQYVTEQPPGKYDGPPKPTPPPATPGTTPAEPAKPASTIPTKPVFVEAAQSVYGFKPEQADEKQFKLAYAKESLAAGLDAEHVSRVYSFETGGMGAADEQPIRKDGTAISTALGYSQILNATTLELMQKHGDEFAAALERDGKTEKAAVVRKMTADAKTAGATEEQLQAFAKTPAGRAIHAANLDVDIGPKLQVQNIVDITNTAKKLGVSDMTPAQLELLNLAGERNGASMMKPELKDLPTSNFFTRAGYEANPVARNRTGAQLLAKIDQTMDEYMTKPGTKDLLAAFASLQPSAR